MVLAPVGWIVLVVQLPFREHKEIEDLLNMKLPTNGSSTGWILLVVQLPFREHKEIEDLLNMNESWETLAGDHLNFTLIDIDKLRWRSVRCLYPGYHTFLIPGRWL
jgi:hypothetical protein